MSPFRRFALPTVTLLAILLPGLLAVFLVQQQEQARLVGEAEDTLRQQTQQIGTAFDELFAPPRAMADSIRDARLLQLDPAEAQRTFFTLAGHAVRHLTQVNGVYLGFPDGSFLQQQQFVPARIADAIGDRLHADMGTRRQIRHLADGRIEDRWFYFDQVTEDWVPAPVATDPYDPRTRPWYQAAETATGTLWTAPYVFASTGKPGVTYAMRLSGFGGALWAVLGLDLTIETLSHILAERRAALGGQGSMIFATSPNGQIVGHAALNDDHGADLIEALHAYNRTGSIEQAFIDAAPPAGTVGGIRFNGTDYIISRAIMNSETAMPLHIYLAQRLDSVTASARADLRRNIWLLLLAMVIVAAIMAYAVKLRVEMAARRQAEQELVAARDQAEAATRAKSNFLATMSHEIRTPMNGVMSMAELLELTPLNGEQHRMAKVIRDSAQALLTVINDILDFSKIEAGKLEIEMVEFSLSDVVDGIGELLAPRADEKMLDLVVSIDPALADHRLGDPTRLRQVLLNLGSNAVKFTHDGSIHIRVTEIPGHKELLRFAVEDSGIGLSAEQMQRLFRPFEQADSSTARKYGGSGLGLSICQRLCELMGGRIGVNSIPGKGSTFWFELPLAAAGTETTRPDLAGLRVLLVGLPPLQQQAIAQYLPAEIIAAPGVAAARIAAAGRTFDLVLVDARCTDGALNAPVMLGLSATYGLVAPRGLVSTIDAAARTHFALALTYPLTGAGLRRAAAIALGQISAGSIASAFREDMAFTPPDLETAHEARAAILVAEDNATNRMVIHQMLSRMGYACEIAENGATALGLYHRHSYGLLLTDFHMPEMDGFELTGHIRSDESATGKPRLPIIALTADALTGTEQQCLDAGMDGYLTKPVNSRALAAMLQHWLPQALPLRRPVQAANAITGGAGDWDPDIFDVRPLTEAFGSFDANAQTLLRDFVDDTEQKVAALTRQIAERTGHAVLRDLSHMLKGAARSVGARRLGNVAGDLQDACDAGDDGRIALLAGMLGPSLDELRQTLPLILKSGDRNA